MENLNQQYTHILEYQLQCEDYWIKPLYIAYTYGLNKKNRNEDLSAGKLLPSLRQYNNCFIETKTKSKISNQDLSSNTETLHL